MAILIYITKNSAKGFPLVSVVAGIYLLWFVVYLFGAGD
jgi:hypothetical protein